MQNDKRSPLAATLCRGCKKYRKCKGSHMENIVKHYKRLALTMFNCYPREFPPEFWTSLQTGAVDLLRDEERQGNPVSP